MEMKAYRFTGGCIVVILAGFLLSSCAGLLLNNEARYAFDAGIALFNQSKFAEAIPNFEKAISADPDYYDAHLYLGRCHLNMRDYGKAVTPLRNAYRLSPQNFKKDVLDILIDALLGAAFAELRQGNLQESLGYAREILSVDPASRTVKDDLSKVFVGVATELFKSGNAREAIKEYMEAIKIDPENSGAYVGMAKALLRNGEFLKALDAAQKAIKLNPESQEALNIVRQLLSK